MEINKYWADLLEAESDHYASNYHQIEDYKKVYDAVLHGCRFGFEERQKEIDLLDKANDITIQQLFQERGRVEKLMVLIYELCERYMAEPDAIDYKRENNI